MTDYFNEIADVAPPVTPRLKEAAWATKETSFEPVYKQPKGIVKRKVPTLKKASIPQRPTFVRDRKNPISFEAISKYFDRPSKDAAKELGICTTALKNRCRSLGIKRWPYRRFKSIERTIDALEQAIQYAYGAEKEELRQESIKLKQLLVQLTKDPQTVMERLNTSNTSTIDPVNCSGKSSLSMNEPIGHDFGTTNDGSSPMYIHTERQALVPTYVSNTVPPMPTTPYCPNIQGIDYSLLAYESSEASHRMNPSVYPYDQGGFSADCSMYMTSPNYYYNATYPQNQRSLPYFGNEDIRENFEYFMGGPEYPHGFCKRGKLLSMADILS